MILAHLHDAGAVGGLNIRALHERTLLRLEKLKAEREKEKKRLEKKQKGIEENSEPWNTIQEKIDALPRETRRKATRIIEDHEFLINTLEQSVVAEEPKGEK